MEFSPFLQAKKKEKLHFRKNFLEFARSFGIFATLAQLARAADL